MPELARDLSEQCQYRKDRDVRCLNEKHGSMAFCEGPHRFAVEAAPVDEPRCIALGNGPHDRCLNPRSGPDGPYCAGGPHRFAPSIGEVEAWNREVRQHNAMDWATTAFTREQSTNLAQRGVRLLEEAIELYQAAVARTPVRNGDSPAVAFAEAKIRAHKLVDYVFDRDVGDLGQEIGGVSVCLLVLAEAASLSTDYAEATELHRVLSKPIGEFTKRNAAKNAAGFLAITPERTTDFNRATDEELALFAAAWHHHATYSVSKDESQHGLRMSLGQLAVAARAWCDAHPNDHRVPTEIAAGVTDKNPTRMHTIKPDGSVPTLGLPGEMPHLRALERAAQLEHENFLDMRTQRDKALDEVGRLTLQLSTERRPRPPATARELHGTTKHRAFAESICDLMYEQLSVCDVNVYGTSERLDRCIVANMLADHLGKLAAGAAPVPMIMHCPACHQRHVDVAFADHPHHTHACQHCGFSWRPAVANTVGVQFLPGFKDEVE